MAALLIPSMNVGRELAFQLAVDPAAAALSSSQLAASSVCRGWWTNRHSGLSCTREWQLLACYDHTIQKRPALIRTRKSTWIGLHQYWGERSPGNPQCRSVLSAGATLVKLVMQGFGRYREMGRSWHDCWDENARRTHSATTYKHLLLPHSTWLPQAHVTISKQS